MAKFKIAIRLTNFLKSVLNILKSKGTALPGKILGKFYPDFLHDAMDYIDGKKISVTGTNGKSTTSSILAAILGEKTIHNAEGANMPQGIATSIALGLQRLGRAQDIVIETDEAYLGQVFKQINFDYLIITNLFEDQVDRHGSPLELRTKIQEAINLNPNLKIILNADDPILSGIEGDKIYFGMNSADIKEGEVLLGGNTYKINLKGLYNAYNACAAIVAALCIGKTPQEIQAALDNFKPLYGRGYDAKVDGKTVKLNLIKNTVGANEVIKSFGKVEGEKFLIAINNEYPDGRDFSWIYKTNFELLADSTNRFFVSGTKAREMTEVLKSKGVTESAITVEPDLVSAVKLGTRDEGDLTALLVFSALAEFEKKFQ